MKKSAALCVLALAATPVFAADEVGMWYLTPQGGYLWTDHDRGVDDDVLSGLTLGKHVSDKWSLELNLHESKHDAGVGELKLDAISIDALRVFGRANRVSPYCTFGAGRVSDNLNPGPSSSDLMAQAGFGLLMRLGDH